MGLLFFFRRRQFRANPRLIRDLLAYNVVFGCQISMIIVYPLYNHLFTQLTSSQQTAFVFILPLLKILYKIWINRALRDTDDAKPEAIIFNVEVFHALFVAYCMQGATSKRTVAALMLIDAAQVWIAFLDIRSILAKVQPIAQKLDQATSSKALHNLLQLTAILTLAEPELLNYATARRLTRPANSATIEPGRMFDDSMRSKPIFGVCVAPQPIAQDPPSDPDRLEPIAPQTKTMSHRFTVLSRVERGVFVHQTLQLFYLTEFLVLIEYTEVIMPLIYSIYVTVISQLRNRTYYQFLQGLTSDQLGPTLANVSLYTSLEFLSLVLMALGLWWSLRIGRAVAKMQYSGNDREHVETVLEQLVKRLKTKEPVLRQQYVKELYIFVATLSRQLSAETYTKLLQQLTPQLYALLQSTQEAEQLGGLAAIDLLIEISTEDQIIRFANYLRHFLAQPNTSRTALLAASAALGHLASSNTTNGVSGTLVAAFVDFEVKRAFEWLQGERQEAIFSQRRLAACFVLRELAQSAPTLFHVNLTTFFQSIWGAIRDVRVEIREAATEALSACLQLIAKRQTRHRVQWYCKVYDQVFEGLNLPSRSSTAGSTGAAGGSFPNRSGSSSSLLGAGGNSLTIAAAPPSSSSSAAVSSSPSSTSTLTGPPTTASWECVHGSLLVISELLQNTGGFMLPRFREVCDTVLLYKDAKDKLVSRTVCVLLPQLAEFCADAFIRYYLNVALNHLMKRVVNFSTPSERGIAFLALGKMGRAIGRHMLPHLPPIVKLVKESLAQTTTKGKRRAKNKLYCIETLTCVADLSKSLKEEFEPYLVDLLEIMMLSGLSDELIDALAEIVQNVPSVLTSIQERLLNEISSTLRGIPFSSVPGELGSGNERDSAYFGVEKGVNGASSVLPGASPPPPPPPQKPATVMQALLSTMRLGGTSPSVSAASPSHSASAVSTASSYDEETPFMLSSSSFAFPVLKGDNSEEVDAILLSLRTLSSFDFSGNFCLLPFVRDCVALYLKNPDGRVRQQAVITCSKLLLPPVRSSDASLMGRGMLSLASSSQNGANGSSNSPSSSSWRHVTKRGPSGRVIDEILRMLLQVATSDLDFNVRKSVVKSLDERFDELLSQDMHLTSLVMLLNDEVADIRELTMRLLERLAPRNPAFVMPSLRRMLIQLLTELEHTSDLRMKEDSTRLIGLLIRSAQHLVDPYIVRILHVLLPKLVAGNASLASAVLVTLGELALVAQQQIAVYEGYLFPLILHALQDHSSIEKRQLALQTMGQLAGSTACVVRPYLAFPKLLEMLLSLLQHSAVTPWPLRREAMKTIGILGALDPYKYKLCISRVSMLEANDVVDGGNTDVNAQKRQQQQSQQEDARLGAPASQVLDIDLAALGVTTLDMAGLERASAMMNADMLDEKQQIELQLFTAAPIGTRRSDGASQVPGVVPAGSGVGATSSSQLPGGGVSFNDGVTGTSIGGVTGRRGGVGTLAADLLDFERLLPTDQHDLVLDPSSLSPGADAYFPTVAISALLKILKEPTLSTHHHGAIQAIMFIFKSLNLQCVPFLPYILPPFLRVLARGEPRLRESLFLQLTTLIGIVNANMKPFFPSTMALVLRFWGQHLPQIIRLIEAMSQAAPVEFRTQYFPKLLPKILEVLQPQLVPELYLEATAPSSSSNVLGSHSSSTDGGLVEVGSAVGSAGGLGATGSTGVVAFSGGGSLSEANGVSKSTNVLLQSSSRDKNPNSQTNQAIAALQIQMVQALIIFGDAVEEYVYLIVPALVRLMESVETPLDVKIVTIYALSRMCVVAKFEQYAGARLLQPLARVARQVSTKSSLFFRSSGTSVTASSSANSNGSSSSLRDGNRELYGGNLNGGNSVQGNGTNGVAPSSGTPSVATIAATKADAKKFSEIVLYALATLVYQLQNEFLNFEPLVAQVIASLPHAQETSTQEMIYKLRQAMDKLRRSGGSSGGGKETVGFEWMLQDPVFAQNSNLRAIIYDIHAHSTTPGGAGTTNSAVPSNAARLHVNQQNLRRAWEASQRSTKEDWLEWMRRFSIELLRESPSAALRSCCALAQAYNPLARELFNPAFVSCWNELYEQYQDYLVRALETAFQSDTIPAEILQTLLNLAEFMEHDVEALPIDIRELGELAQKCHAYAKALHYKELEFHTSPATCIEALISINNQLGQPEAAVGILKYAQQHHHDVIHVQETWYEKLQDWNAALHLYDAKIAALEEAQERVPMDVWVGKMRCLEALGEWEALAALADQVSAAVTEEQSASKTPQLGARRSHSSASLSMMSIPPPPRSLGPGGSVARLSSTGSIGPALSRHGSFTAVGGGGGPSADENSESAMKRIAMLGAKASWCLAKWDQMASYVDVVSGTSNGGSSKSSPWSGLLLSQQQPVSSAIGAYNSVASALGDGAETDSALFRAVLAVHRNQFGDALRLIDDTRKSLDTSLGALVGESYSRAYRSMVTLQQLSELEEVLMYKQLRVHVAKTEDAARYKRHLMRMWQARLQNGCTRVVDVWQQILAVRSLILTPQEDIDTWLQFASLCRQSGNLSMSLKVFTNALGVQTSTGATSVALPELGHVFGYGEREQHRVAFAYLKHLWAVGDKNVALQELQTLVSKISPSPTAPRNRPKGSNGASVSSSAEDELIVKCHLKLGEWQLAIHDQQLDRVMIPSILASLKLCTDLEPKSYKAWHAWALMNFHVVEYYTGSGPSAPSSFSSTSPTTGAAAIGPYIAPAIEGFFRSIALGRSRWAANVQQDILRVLTLWFSYGHRSDVHQTLVQGFQSVSIETWLIVIPQLIARIHTPYQRIQTQLHRLLCAIGAQHPHALIYPLSVALKSPLEVRQRAAEAIMTTMRRHYVELVDEALLVSRELIRVAILWHEMWHEGLEEASRLYFGEQDVDGMIAVLEPLHQMMEQGPETLREASFQQAFGRDLREAYEWLQRFLHSNRKNESDLNRAWDLYYHVFRRINKQLPQLTTLELQYVSPNLLQARNLQLAVPGTYRAGHHIVKIGRFMPTIQVITSKQRPRRITLVGSNGLEYMFLLKGHEDLRQDERVTQLFGLVNALLINDRTTAKKELQIHRYPVIPLSNNAGIIGWVPYCDTLHQLIRDYREARKILLNIEHRLMLQMAPDYDALPLLQKVEVFEYALENTAGQDLYKVLWLKSENSEVWLDRRTKYTRSLAVMSMVGYILGLGDRHPSNLMLHRFTGTIVHIDFGDCFEVAMHREKYPEKIPFRLTRMLTNAMEVSGIEGNFRFSCERVMTVLRENRHSLMAMLEAFVHDPLICWRLLAPNQKDASPSYSSSAGSSFVSRSSVATSVGVSVPRSIPRPIARPEESAVVSQEVKAEQKQNATQEAKPGTKEVNDAKEDQSEAREEYSSSSDEEDDKEDVAESLSASAMLVSKMPKRPRPVRRPVEGGEREAKAQQPPPQASKPVAASMRAPLPPRPSTSVASSFRPTSVSKSIAFTRQLPPRASSVTNNGPGADEGDEDNEPVQRIDHATTNLHAEIANLAASLSNVGQTSLRRSFSRTAAEAVAAVTRATAAATPTPQPAIGQAGEAATSDEANASNAEPDSTAAPVGGGVVRAKARRASISIQQPGNAAAQPPAQVAQSQTKGDVHANRSHRERELVNALGPEGTAAPREALNERAVAVIRRVQAKLTGRDFEGEAEPLDVTAQVQRLITQATSHENLCQCYIGWCPFCIKLEPPTSKAWEMPRFWTRGTLFTLSLAISNLEHFRHQKPHINLPHRVIVLISALATAIGILQAFAIACYVANPIPFAMLVAAPLWIVILIGSLRFYLRHQIRSQPSLKKDLRQYFVYCSIQLSVPLLYPVYHYAFSSLDSNLQAAFVLVLSLMKLAFKNALSYALGDQDDLKPETIILNVEVFHALFVTYSMQNATSAATVVMLVANDFVHACASLYDVNNLLGQITALVNSIKRRSSLDVTIDMSVMDIALLIIDRDPAGAGDVANMRRMASSKAAWVAFVTRSRQIAPLFSASPTVTHIPKRGPIRSQRNSRVSSNEYTRALPVHGVPPPRPQNERRALLRKTLQLFYLTEFIMLVEFVEIVIPTIYWGSASTLCSGYRIENITRSLRV
ncbi:hypothetical protein Poli38472_010696 [Pythium oligandrum]|uniref:non-specific serine/threonine protein kinase n=1 Tax=Pythium oligandrum TaxID=41045 RepID=A0A8K1FKD9_PYTOL|nr:hypothetical protein Poli38472_010696 [Pythium oligandrum]|eukprot:TMW61633.1 hypothetical protein Poli38472_010696 [Pythium oligandrum]